MNRVLTINCRSLHEASALLRDLSAKCPHVKVLPSLTLVWDDRAAHLDENYICPTQIVREEVDPGVA